MSSLRSKLRVVILLVSSWVVPSFAIAQPLPPDLRFLGPGFVSQGWYFDFENNNAIRVNDESQVDADVLFLTEDGTYRSSSLVPKNGAMLAILPVGTPLPARATCLNAHLSTSPIPAPQIAQGRYICLKTRRGTLARVFVSKIEQLSLNNGLHPYTINFGYALWR